MTQTHKRRHIPRIHVRAIPGPVLGNRWVVAILFFVALANLMAYLEETTANDETARRIYGIVILFSVAAQTFLLITPFLFMTMSKAGASSGSGMFLTTGMHRGMSRYEQQVHASNPLYLNVISTHHTPMPSTIYNQE